MTCSSTNPHHLTCDAEGINGFLGARLPPDAGMKEKTFRWACLCEKFDGHAQHFDDADESVLAMRRSATEYRNIYYRSE